MKNVDAVADFFEPVQSGCTLRRVAGYKHLHMVIAPHPDDDVIGAGGMMALLGRSRRPVVVVFVTNGVSSVGGAAATARVRRREALEALQIVQARAAFFLPFSSCDVREYPDLVQSVLMSVCRQIEPQVLYLPCPFEQHATHRLVTRMALKGLRAGTAFAGELWGYCVWSALPPAPLVRSVDITRVAHLKRAAVEQHASQAALKDYAGGILGLNRYAAVFSSAQPDKRDVRYVEQFVDMRMLLNSRRISMERFAARVFVRTAAGGDAKPHW